MKKFKLLASIASMCLAIAVLCFGVFAASSVTYTISGTITYDVSDVFVNVKTSVYSFADALSSTDLQKYADGIKAKGAQETNQTVSISGADKTFKYTNQTGSYTNGGSGKGIISGSGDLTTSGLNLAYSNTNGYSYFIVITVSNLASKALKVTPSNETWGGSVNSVHYVSATNSTGIAKGASDNFVIAMSIVDKKVAINAANNFGLTLTFAY